VAGRRPSGPVSPANGESWRERVRGFSPFPTTPKLNGTTDKVPLGPEDEHRPADVNSLRHDREDHLAPSTAMAPRWSECSSSTNPLPEVASQRLAKAFKGRARRALFDAKRHVLVKPSPTSANAGAIYACTRAEWVDSEPIARARFARVLSVPSASLLAPRIDWLSLVGGRPQRPPTFSVSPGCVERGLKRKRDQFLICKSTQRVDPVPAVIRRTVRMPISATTH
jgi:hypothetical protein